MGERKRLRRPLDLEIAAPDLRHDLAKMGIGEQVGRLAPFGIDLRHRRQGVLGVGAIGHRRQVLQEIDKIGQPAHDRHAEIGPPHDPDTVKERGVKQRQDGARRKSQQRQRADLRVGRPLEGGD
ncbi:hypothetical protein D3C80_1511180 [compost metagenome]